MAWLRLTEVVRGSGAKRSLAPEDAAVISILQMWKQRSRAVSGFLKVMHLVE